MNKLLLCIIPTLLLLSGCRFETRTRTEADYARASDYPSNTVSVDQAARYQALLDGWSANGLPGAAMVVDGPSGFWAGSSGLIDLDNRIAAQDNTLYRIGSVTKTFIAATVMILSEEGLLSVDDLAASYLPYDMSTRLFGASMDKITIRQLLSHRSGLGGFYQLNNAYQLAETIETINDLSRVWTVDEVIALSYGEPLIFPPGTDYCYSNLGYVLLGKIIEQVEGKPLRQVLAERIISPLGLASTSLSTPGTLPPGLARGYQALYGDGRIYDMTDYNNVDSFSAGAIVSDAYDVSRFFHALFGLSFFGQDSLDAMTGPESTFDVSATPDFSAVSYGFGIQKIVLTDGTEILTHNGQIFGYFAEVLYFPDNETSIVMLSNCYSIPAVDAHIPFTVEVLRQIGTGAF